MCRWLSMLSLFAWVGLLPSCDRNTEAFVEGEKPRPPDLARIFPESDPSSQRPGLAPPLPPASGRGAAPVQRQNPTRAPAQGSADSISGSITLAPELGAAVPAQAVLFVVARAAGVQAGPPMAVLRIPNPSFPMAFEIGPENVMIPSMRFQGPIDLTARVDGDGNAMTRLPGDLSGGADQTHAPGSSAVRLVLDQKL